MKTVDKHNLPRGWHSRGYLPHFDGGEIFQFISLRLGDAVPQHILEQWQLGLKYEKDEEKRRLLYWKMEKYLDQGHGGCYLRQEKIAEQAQESLLHFDSIRYKLLAWVVMPNHTHCLLLPINNWSLSDIMQRFKSFTSHECNKILQRQGKFWQDDYFDRFIRNEEHFNHAVAYIENNPVKAGLCKKPEDWQFSSAYYRAHKT